MPTVILAPLRCSQSASGPSLDIRLTAPQFKSNPKILFTLDLARLASLASRSGQRERCNTKGGALLGIGAPSTPNAAVADTTPSGTCFRRRSPNAAIRMAVP
jgi:hypothetical protein